MVGKLEVTAQVQSSPRALHLSISFRVKGERWEED
ncbi:hypothetical protein CM49_01308 [Paenibacillus sp. P1XP2]|nr:hypothetical protein CM49_01308 [Paenibacillus sp. P1XP2]